MTCIIGIIGRDDKVYIGGDSAGANGYGVTIRKDPKVFRVGNFIIGCTSSYRMIQLIRFSFSPPEIGQEQDIYEYMCTGFINGIRACFKEGGFMQVDKSAEEGGTFLVGYKNRLFEIGCDFQVEESADGINAIGCGDRYAIGAMYAIRKIADPSMSPEEKIRIGLEISAYKSDGVRPPWIILNT